MFASFSTRKTSQAAHKEIQKGCDAPFMLPACICLWGVVCALGELLLTTADSCSVSLFLDQVSDDLSSYAHHAGRATIERADVELLLSRCGLWAFGSRRRALGRVMCAHPPAFAVGPCTCRQRLTTGPSAPGLDDLIRRFLPMEYVEALIPVARAHNKVVPEPPHHGKVRLGLASSV